MQRTIMPVALIAAMVLAGCGADSGVDASDRSEDLAEAVGVPTTPEYAESETCRDDMQPVVDLMLANEVTSLDLETFSRRQKRLNREIDDAVLACSNKVVRPARGAMYEFAMADLVYTLCDNDPSCTFDDDRLDEIEDSIVKGIGKADRARVKLAAFTTTK